MKLSIVVPVYNELETLEEVVDAIHDCGVEEFQLIVVDDCSSDGTRELLEGDLGKKADIVVFHEGNQGKGAALRTGVEYAEGEYVIFQDADLEYNPKEYRDLIAAVGEPGIDGAYGSRFLGRGFSEVSPFWHRVVNGVLTVFSNLCTGYRVTDMESCYKLLPTSFLKSIRFEENAFGIEPELTAKAAYAGLRLADVPISYACRSFEEGKKIGAKDGIRALYVIAKYGLRFL